VNRSSSCKTRLKEESHNRKEMLFVLVNALEQLNLLLFFKINDIWNFWKNEEIHRDFMTLAFASTIKNSFMQIERSFL